MSKLLAPNGKPSKLTPEQYKLVRTPEFKAWFGDWENSPETASKVVDSNGEPLVVYHGTNADFTIFDTDEESENRKGGVWNAEYPDGYIFMISDKNQAKYYGKRIIPLFVLAPYPTIKKVKKGESLVLPFDDEGLAYEGDAIVTDGINYVVGTQDDNAVKLADGSNTTFDVNNPDIRFKKGGDTKNKIMEKQMEIKFDKNYAEGGVTYSEFLKDDYWQEQFDAWMQDGNVSKKADGTYSTQDAQYRNSLKGMSELKKYFYNEFIKGQNSGYFADGGGVEEYDAETLKRKKSEMNISINTQTGQVYVGGLKPKNKLYIDDKGYHLIEGYSKFMNKKYPIKKYFSPIENVVLSNYMNNKFENGGSADDKHLIAKAIEYITGYSVDTNTIQKEANNYSFKYKSRNVFSTLNAKLIDDTIRMHRKSLENRYKKGGEAGKDIYDFDKKMALINLGQVYEYVIKIDKMIKENTDLEEWVKMKLTRIEQNISDVKHSLEGWEKYKSGGEIAKKQLLHIAKYSKDLIEMIEGGSKLMSWQENKLAVSSDSIDNIYHHLDYQMGNRAEDLDVNNEYARGGRPRNKSKEKVLNVRSRGGFTLDDFNPKLNLYDKIVSYKKVGELELNQISEKKYVEDTFEFKTEKDRDYWYDILTEEQEKYFTIKNKKKYVNYILEWHDPYSEKAEEEGITKKSEMLDYFFEEIDYELRLNTSREDFIKTLDLQTKFEDGGDSEGYADGGVVEYETKRIVNEAKNQKKNTHFAIHKLTNSIVFTWDYSGYDTKEMNENKEHYFYYDVKDIVSGNVDKYVKSDYAIVQRKDLEKRGIDLNNYLVFMGQKYDSSESNSDTDSGKTGFNNEGTSMVLYHEKNGNFLVPKGQVYLWLYDNEGSSEKLQSEEYDWVFYPYASQNMAWASDFIPPLKKIWTKKFQKEHKGSEHLLGVIKAYLIDKENGEKELYIDMMSVNPTKMKKGIMSYMIKELRDTFKLKQDQVTFSQLTEEGKKFVEKKTYADGGGVGEFPPKGELTNKDNFLLKYEKKGGEYEFFVYKPITKEVSGYNQIKHVCLNKDCPQKMNYEQFINYLYAELYLDDTQYADGGGLEGNSNRNETQKNNFGVSYKLGDKFTLGQNFGNKKEEVYITEIMPSGLFFKVDKSSKVFSIKTLHSKGSTYTSGEYLVPIKKEYADGGGVENKIQLKNFSDLKQGDVIRRKEPLGTTIFVVVKSPVQSRMYKNEYNALVTCVISNTNVYKPLEQYYITSVIKYGKLGNVDYLGKWNYDDKVDYSIYLPKSRKKFADGGDIPHEDKMFHLPLEMVVYVPSTQDVDKVISVDEMVKRVNEVKEYLGSKFGGYSSTDKLGGFVDSKGNLINEDVTQVTSFATKEAFKENKEELIQQLAKWGKEWGQEAIGFEFEGDLLYVPQEL